MSEPTPARALWEALEPLHAVVYFSPESIAAMRDVGLKGFWMGYFAGRAAPMGAVAPAVVDATFYNFHPSRTSRALPDAWAFAEPETILRAHMTAAAAALRRLLDGAPDLPETVALARDAAQACATEGRPLAAAWAAVQWPDDDTGALWLAATILREHRGDGHVAALVAKEISGCAAHVLMSAGGGAPRELLQAARGWSDDDWAAAEADLTARGWLDAAGLTADGVAARQAIEARTDALAAAPYAALGAAGAARLLELADRLAERVVAADAIPFPNPIGLPARAAPAAGP